MTMSGSEAKSPDIRYEDGVDDFYTYGITMCPFYSRKKQCTYSAEVFDFGAIGALSWENDYLVSSQRREQRPANHHRLRD